MPSPGAAPFIGDRPPVIERDALHRTMRACSNGRPTGKKAGGTAHTPFAALAPCHARSLSPPSLSASLLALTLPPSRGGGQRKNPFHIGEHTFGWAVLAAAKCGV